MSAKLEDGLEDRYLPTVRVRAMSLADTAAVMSVERGAYDFPWTEGIFRDCVRVGYICRVVEVEGGIAGYGVMTLGAGEAHLLNLCVREDVRRRGVGRRLLELLIDQARTRGAEDLFLEVRPSNAHAIRLYLSIGFNQIGVRKSYYQAVGGREDALVFRLRLQSGP